MGFISYSKGLLIAISVIIVGIIIWDYVDTSIELESKKYELLILSDKMREQNEAIKSLSLDIEKYKNKKPQIVEKIVTKYNEIQVKDKTCEAYMKAIYDSQLVFYNRKQK